MYGKTTFPAVRKFNLVQKKLVSLSRCRHIQNARTYIVRALNTTKSNSTDVYGDVVFDEYAHT